MSKCLRWNEVDPTICFEYFLRSHPLRYLFQTFCDVESIEWGWSFILPVLSSSLPGKSSFTPFQHLLDINPNSRQNFANWSEPSWERMLSLSAERQYSKGHSVVYLFPIYEETLDLTTSFFWYFSLSLCIYFLISLMLRRFYFCLVKNDFPSLQGSWPSGGDRDLFLHSFTMASLWREVH